MPERQTYTDASEHDSGARSSSSLQRFPDTLEHASSPRRSSSKRGASASEHDFDIRTPFVSADPRLPMVKDGRTIWCTDEEQAEWESLHPKPAGFDRHRKRRSYRQSEEERPSNRQWCGYIGINPVTKQRVRMCEAFPRCPAGCTEAITFCLNLSAKAGATMASPASLHTLLEGASEHVGSRYRLQESKCS